MKKYLNLLLLTLLSLFFIVGIYIYIYGFYFFQIQVKLFFMHEYALPLSVRDLPCNKWAECIMELCNNSDFWAIFRYTSTSHVFELGDEYYSNKKYYTLRWEFIRSFLVKDGLYHWEEIFVADCSPVSGK